MYEDTRRIATLEAENSELRQRIATLEGELHASEVRYRMLSEVVNDFAFSFRVEPDGRLVPEWITNAAVDILAEETVQAALEQDDWLGKIAAEDYERVMVSYEGLLKGIPALCEFRIQRPDGTLRWLRARARPVWDASLQRVIRFYGAAQDITDEKVAAAALEQRVAARTAELRTSEALLQSILDHAPVAINTTDLEGRFTLVNRYMLNVLELTRAEMLGQPISALLPPEIVQKADTALEAIRQTGEPQVCEYRLHMPDEWHTFHAHIFPIVDDAGMLIAFGSVAVDITQRLRAEIELRDSEARYRTLVNALPVMVIVSNAQGRILFVNPAGAHQMGVDHPGQLIGRNVMDYLLPAEHETASRRLHAVETDREPDVIEYRIRVPSGQLMDIEVFESPVSYQGQRAMLSIVRDITEYKRMAHQLQQQAAELRTINKELALAARTKDEFLANMSHELRTPLNAILGLSEALQEEVYGTLSPQQQSSLSTIEESGRHLLELINDLLDLAKIEAGQFDVQMAPTSVAEVCQASLRLVRQAAQKKQLWLSEELDGVAERIYADERRLKQILVNLLSNAVKFTPAGGQVGIEVRGNRQTDHVAFSVWDTGVGIAPEHQARLFLPFVQVDGGLNRQHEGTGLGLTLVARLVEMHQGRVEVESTVGEGSRFTVTLPWHQERIANAQQPETAPAAPEPSRLLPAPRRSGEPASILLVEDNVNNVRMLVGYLQAKDHDVRVAQSGREALASIEEELPALILLDIQMPDMDGFEVMRHLRANPRTAQVPIIAVTALAMPGDRERCLAAGADDYISKPVSVRTLSQVIQSYLGQHGEA
jgi:PAS domain S-box-containing protein